VGQRVLQRLQAADQPVVAVDAVPLANARGAQTWLIDLARDPRERMETAMAGAAGVIHLAWSHADPPSSDPAVPFPNLAALRRVLEAAAEAGIERLVHVSSATVYGAWPDNPVPLTEDAPLRPNPGFAYAVEKAEAERLIAEWTDDHPDVRVTVLRPTVTVGSSSPALYQALAGTLAPQSDAAVRPMQFLDVGDLVAAIVLAWERQLDGVFNVAPDGFIDQEQARAIVGGVARLRLPERWAGIVSSLGWRLLRTGAPAPARPYLVHPWVVANNRLRAAGWVPRSSNEQALASAADGDGDHWGDRPADRLQTAILVGAGVGLAAVATAVMAATATWLWRRRRR
jgi:nucleoside-diphosphate-sugar epimerase